MEWHDWGELQLSTGGTGATISNLIRGENKQPLPPYIPESSSPLSPPTKGLTTRILSPPFQISASERVLGYAETQMLLYPGLCFQSASANVP